MQLPACACLPLLILTSASVPAAQPAPAPSAPSAFRVRVDAGEYARENCLVTFDLPRAARVYRLTDAKGEAIPLQSDLHGRATFFLPQLQKGLSSAFLLRADDTAAPGHAAAASLENGRLKLLLHGKPLLEYQAHRGSFPRPDIAEVYRRGGYIHPVLTPQGKVVTDHYAPNHLHQQGIWFAWTKTEFQGRHPDFWNMGQGTAAVEFTGLLSHWSGAVHAGFIAHHRFTDYSSTPGPTVALTESWEVRAYAAPAAPAKSQWFFDLISRQQCASPQPLRLPKYHYGGLGVRGNWAWNGPDKAFFLTSDGESDRVKANESRVRWCDLWGELDGGPAGLAVLSHPSNFQAPQPLRAHPGEPYLSLAPSQVGDWEIQPGQTYVSRYRFVIHDGKPDRAELDRLWNDYAHPPHVTLEPLAAP